MSHADLVFLNENRKSSIKLSGCHVSALMLVSMLENGYDADTSCRLSRYNVGHVKHQH